ncbi:hypothetical protein TRVA0_004S02256 [Trichomonascus vanleenenianus]|uniref:uncharacterized protein n=1 Tax=Trichomonascus vanleenenianus TaxID=2268995 RepID=UPI003ECAD64C
MNDIPISLITGKTPSVPESYLFSFLSPPLRDQIRSDLSEAQVREIEQKQDQLQRDLVQNIESSIEILRQFAEHVLSRSKPQEPSSKSATPSPSPRAASSSPQPLKSSLAKGSSFDKRSKKVMFAPQDEVSIVEDGLSATDEDDTSETDDNFSDNEDMDDDQYDRLTQSQILGDSAPVELMSAAAGDESNGFALSKELSNIKLDKPTKGSEDEMTSSSKSDVSEDMFEFDEALDIGYANGEIKDSSRQEDLAAVNVTVDNGEEDGADLVSPALGSSLPISNSFQLRGRFRPRPSTKYLKEDADDLDTLPVSRYSAQRPVDMHHIKDADISTFASSLPITISSFKPHSAKTDLSSEIPGEAVAFSPSNAAGTKTNPAQMSFSERLLWEQQNQHALEHF